MWRGNVLVRVFMCESNSFGMTVGTVVWGKDGSCASIVFREMLWLACPLSAGTIRCKPRRSDAVHALCNLTHVHGT